MGGRLISEDKILRTLLIAPTFLAVFGIAIFSVGWLITTGGEDPSNSGAMPPPPLAAWLQTLEAQQKARDPGSAELHERIEELGQY